MEGYNMNKDDELKFGETNLEALHYALVSCQHFNNLSRKLHKLGSFIINDFKVFQRLSQLY